MNREKRRGPKARRLAVVFLILFGCLTVTAKDSRSETSDPSAISPKERLRLPVLNLPSPQTEAEKKYLGLSRKEGVFQVVEIKARLLIIEIYSMYCPHCQKEAPQVNQLYRAILERPDLEEAVKIIGIGAGNSAYEVDLFKKKYGVPFPLFPDRDLSITRLLDVNGTPTFIAVKMTEGGTQERLCLVSGGLGDVHQFLEKLLKLAGMP